MDGGAVLRRGNTVAAAPQFRVASVRLSAS